jgi:hypothetical protein
MVEDLTDLFLIEEQDSLTDILFEQKHLLRRR